VLAGWNAPTQTLLPSGSARTVVPGTLLSMWNPGGGPEAQGRGTIGDDVRDDTGRM
jgi:hypothetical protein